MSAVNRIRGGALIRGRRLLQYFGKNAALNRGRG